MEYKPQKMGEKSLATLVNILKVDLRPIVTNGSNLFHIMLNVTSAGEMMNICPMTF